VRAGARVRQQVDGGGQQPQEVEERPLTLDESIKLVKTGSRVDQQQKAAQFLIAAPVVEQRRGEVVSALRATFDDHESGCPRHEFLDAMVKWAAAAEVPYFIRLLEDQDGNIKIKAITMLGKLKDARAAEPLAQRLHESPYRKFVSQALKDLGPAAEKAVAAF